MSAYETFTFEMQLKAIGKEETEMDAANDALRAFILSDDFMKDKKKFDDLTSQLEAHLVTLTEEVEKPMPMAPGTQNFIPGPPAGNNGAQVQKTLDQAAATAESFNYTKAAVISAGIIASCLLTFTKIIPPAWFVGILATAFIFLFSDQAKAAIAYFQDKKPEEDMTTPMRLENWIIESFQWMRERYTSAFLLIEVQTNSKKTLPNWALPDQAENLYNRKLYFDITLPTEFLTRIGRIIISCKKNVWARKQVLINAIAVTKSASAGASKA